MRGPLVDETPQFFNILKQKSLKTEGFHQLFFLRAKGFLRVEIIAEIASTESIHLIINPKLLFCLKETD